MQPLLKVLISVFIIHPGMWLWLVLTLLVCFSCAAAGTAVLQPHRWAVSPGTAACLQPPNPLKTSSCICGPILYIPVYCFRIFIWEIGNFAWLGLTPKGTWDWQTNKQAALKITNPVGRHHDGRKVSQRHSHSVTKDSPCWLIASQTQHTRCVSLQSIYLKRDTVNTYHG